MVVCRHMSKVSETNMKFAAYVLFSALPVYKVEGFFFAEVAVILFTFEQYKKKTCFCCIV